MHARFPIIRITRDRIRVTYGLVSPPINPPMLAGSGVRDQITLKIQDTASAVPATLLFLFQNSPNTTIQKTGTIQANTQLMAFRISGSATDTARAAAARTIIQILVILASFFSSASGLIYPL